MASLPEMLISTTHVPFPRVGAIVTLEDGQGKEWRGRITRIEGTTAWVQPFEGLPLPSESPLDLTLIQALPKKEKMEFIIQKATELGVARICPCVSERSITLHEREQKQAKSLRWPSIAAKAAEQSRRRIVPDIAPLLPFREALRLVQAAELKLLLYEGEADRRLEDVRHLAPSSVAVVCGAEGGFTQDEVSAAAGLGYVPVRLGGRILRCETAALAALALLQFMYGDL